MNDPQTSKKAARRRLDLQVNIRVDEPLRSALTEIAMVRYSSISAIMREALLDLLKKYDRLLSAGNN